VTFVWPFARLRFRLRRGYWCQHTGWADYPESGERVPLWEPGDQGREDGWVMIDLGRRQMRRCSLCQHVEFR
jgi:hypothetical protein